MNYKHKIYPRKRLAEIAYTAITEGTTPAQIIAAVRVGIQQGRKVMAQIEADQRAFDAERAWREKHTGTAAAARYAKKHVRFGREKRRTSRRS